MKRMALAKTGTLVLALLVMASRRKVMAGDNTTGHVWDEDLRELNNPLPRWWMGLFVLTVVFAAVYLALYPGLGANPGLLKWSSQAQWEAEQAQSRAALSSTYARFVELDAPSLAVDPQARAIGERLFVNHCAACRARNLTPGQLIADNVRTCVVEPFQRESGAKVDFDVQPFAGSLEKQRNSVRAARGKGYSGTKSRVRPMPNSASTSRSASPSTAAPKGDTLPPEATQRSWFTRASDGRRAGSPKACTSTRQPRAARSRATT